MPEKISHSKSVHVPEPTQKRTSTMVERETVTTATIKKWRAVVRLENPDEEVKEDEGDAAADTIETKPEDIEE